MSQSTPRGLPADSVLDLSDYLAMQRTIGDETRYRILTTLIEGKEEMLSAKELREALDVPSNRLHYHLDKLVDVGLVHNRKRKTHDEDGLRSYYVATKLAETLLDHGIKELIDREAELRDRYSDEKPSSGETGDGPNDRTSRRTRKRRSPPSRRRLKTMKISQHAEGDHPVDENA